MVVNAGQYSQTKRRFESPELWIHRGILRILWTENVINEVFSTEMQPNSCLNMKTGEISRTRIKERISRNTDTHTK